MIQLGEDLPSDVLVTKTTRLRVKIAKLGDEMQRLAGIEARMLESPDQQVSLTDPDARSMATSGRGSGVVDRAKIGQVRDVRHHAGERRPRRRSPAAESPDNRRLDCRASGRFNFVRRSSARASRWKGTPNTALHETVETIFLPSRHPTDMCVIDSPSVVRRSAGREVNVAERT